MDRILLEDMHLQCIVGVLPEERTTQREIVVRVALDVDLLSAGVSDDIGDTVDYRQVEAGILAAVQGSDRGLIESLAHDVARACLRVNGVSRVAVRLEKPGALAVARNVVVEVERTREHFPELSA